MKKLKDILDNYIGIDGYRVTEKTVLSYELFFVHRDLETVRSTDTTSTEVTVYVNHGEFEGESAFHVFKSMTEDDIKAKIKSAAARASLVNNKPYELPGKGELTAELPTNLDGYEPKTLGRMIADAVYDADDTEGGSINALEIFIYRDTTRVVNSRGVDKKQTVNRVMIEAIPTFTDEKQSVELYEDYRFTVFDKEKITAEIREKMKEVADRYRAEKPGKELLINVVLRPFETAALCGQLSYDCNYRSIYSHANLHKEGDDLQTGDGDKINLTMRGVIEGSENSAFFDADGAPLYDKQIIKDGVVCGSYGPVRFGQYLGIKEPSGNLGCIELGAGTLEDEEIEKEPYIECVSMSGIQIDLYNDYIGGEIRLAYLHENGKTTPVTGISMSAKLSNVLSTLRLSKKTDVVRNYKGPVKLLMKGVSVL